MTNQTFTCHSLSLYSSNPTKDSFATITTTAIPGRMTIKTLRCDFNLLEMYLSTGHQRKRGSKSCQLQELSVNVKAGKETLLQLTPPVQISTT